MKIILKKGISIPMGHNGNTLFIPEGTVGERDSINVFSFSLGAFAVVAQHTLSLVEYEEYTEKLNPTPSEWEEAKKARYAPLKYCIREGAGECPKCRERSISATYKKESNFGNWHSSDPYQRELFEKSCYGIMERQCRRCNYIWHEIPLDEDK